MSKPRSVRLQVDKTFQPIDARFRPRLVFSADDRSGLSSSIARQTRILLVEDDYLVSGEVELELTAAGFDVVGIATSASEALKLALSKKPDLTVMDIGIDGPRDGVDAAIDIFELTGIRTLFASAYYNPETRERAEPCSPLGWLPKPYTMASLVEAVRLALKSLDR